MKRFLIGIAALFLATGTAHAAEPPKPHENILNAWHCDIDGTAEGTDVELRREGVHMFELHLEFSTPHPAERGRWKSPLISHFDEKTGNPIGRFTIEFNKRGMTLNGKRCRIACIRGNECE